MGHSERLSALDNSFLEIEHGGAHMHIGSLVVLKRGDLGTPEGGVDFERICRHVESALQLLPRYRQRLSRVPGLGHPVWIDDEHFRLSYHLRHTALPRPGDERQLKRLAGRVFSGRLDRDRPLWEMWVVEGLQGDQFALVLKVHHCLVDGVGGAGLLVALLGPPAESRAWEPRAAAGPLELLRDELGHRARNVRALLSGQQDLGIPASRDGLSGNVAHTVDLIRSGLTPCSASPLNPTDVGPHRRFDVYRSDLEQMKRLKGHLGGKLNDVVLATAAGALRRHFQRRNIDPASLQDFRCMVPVNTRRDDSTHGNRVGMMFVRLPLGEPNPARRYAAILEQSQHAKHAGGHAQVTELFEEISDRVMPWLVTSLMQLSGMVRTMNVVITNVPGPPQPLSLMGAEVLAAYPLVPLFRNQGLGIALFSYRGAMHWGLNSDWAVVPDLHLLVEDLDQSFRELQALAPAAH